MAKVANYVNGIHGKLISINPCKTGSLRIGIETSPGTVVKPVMHHSFPQVKSVMAKANTLLGKNVTTKVSQTTGTWSADKYFADLN